MDNQIKHLLDELFPCDKKEELNLSIVTAADESFFDLLQLMLYSILSKHKVKIYVFDLGLTSKSIKWLKGLNIKIKKPKKLQFEKGIKGWQTYNKPFYIKEIKDPVILWLDCDLVVLKSLIPLESTISDKPLFTQCFPEVDPIRQMRTHGDPMLAENILHNVMETNLIPHQTGPPYNNGGVLGMDKRRKIDNKLLEKWINVSIKVSNNEELIQVTQGGYWDQCILQWVLESENELLNISKNKGWNYPEKIKHDFIEQINYLHENKNERRVPNYRRKHGRIISDPWTFHPPPTISHFFGEQKKERTWSPRHPGSHMIPCFKDVKYLIEDNTL